MYDGKLLMRASVEVSVGYGHVGGCLGCSGDVRVYDDHGKARAATGTEAVCDESIEGHCGYTAIGDVRV